MIIERIKRKIEPQMFIVPQSTPVIYFGNYDKARACTISLNPSNKEFLDNKDNLLVGKKERLCSRLRLNKKDSEVLTNSDTDIVIDCCNNYFRNNPYRNWFNKNEHMINKFGYSYFNDTCVHLDLVQWATSPFWGDLDDEIKTIHLKYDLPVLKYLLNKNFGIMFLNGYTTMNNVCTYLNINAVKDTNLTFRYKNGNEINIKVYTGKYNNIKIIGWSPYLQSPTIGGYDNIDILYDTIIKYI